LELPGDPEVECHAAALPQSLAMRALQTANRDELQNTATVPQYEKKTVSQGSVAVSPDKQGVIHRGVKVGTPEGEKVERQTEGRDRSRDTTHTSLQEEEGWRQGGGCLSTD